MTAFPIPTSNPSPLAPLFDIEPTLGSFFLGAITSVGLTGVTTLQCWLYFLKYPQDVLRLKLLVLLVWILEIVRSAISIHAGYHYSVKHWGNMLSLLTPVWSMKLMILLTNVIELVVHAFFIHKVWQTTYGQAKLLCGIITLFALGDFAMGTVAYVLAMFSSSYIEILQGTPERFATAALCCAIGADWLITGSLVKFFRDSKNQFPRTSHLLKRLIFYAVNMGLLTSLTGVVVLILANVSWETFNFYQLAVFEVVGNLYANSLLACLNARDMVSEELQRQPTVPTYNLTGSMATTMHHIGSNQAHSLSQPAWASSDTQSSQSIPPNSFAFKSRTSLNEPGIAV